MQTSLKSLLAIFLVAGVSLVNGGDITGKVTLKGTPPPEKDIFKFMDALCKRTHAAGEKVTTRFYVTAADGGLADVFVYLKSGVKGHFTPPSKPVIISQHGCEYVPYVIGVQTGQKILIKNTDPVLHNVHPTPRVPGNKEFNRAQLPKGKDLEAEFDQPEISLRFKCDVHPWMFAYVSVVPHPFFAVTDKNGNFKIANVPPGEYEIEAVHRKTHPRGKGIIKKIKVGPEGAKVDFVVDIRK